MERNVKLTGDSTTLVTALKSAAAAMRSFTKAANNAESAIGQLKSLSNIDSSNLKGIQEALKGTTRYLKAIAKVDLSKIQTGVSELAKVDFSGVNSLSQDAPKNIRSLTNSMAKLASDDGSTEKLAENLKKIEPVLTRLADNARKLAENLNKLGVTKLKELKNNFDAGSVSAQTLAAQLRRGERSVESLSDAEEKLLRDQIQLVNVNKRWLTDLSKGDQLIGAAANEGARLLALFRKGAITIDDMSDEQLELVKNTAATTNANKALLAQLNGTKKASAEINITWESIARYWVTGTVIGQVRQFTQQIREATLNAAELSVKLAEIQTIAGGAISASDLEIQVRQLSDTFTGTTVEQAEAFYQALSNGVVDAANAQKFLITSNKLALASVTDVGNATNLLSSIINSYSLSTEEAARVSDVFFKAVEIGRFRLGEIANTIGRTTVIASQVGASYEEVAASLAFLTKQGTTAANAQTLLRQLLIKIIKPTKETKRILSELGAESGEALVQARGLGGALIALFEATRGGSSEIAKLFNNVRGLQGALALGRNGFQDYNDVLAKIIDSQGAAAEAADKISNSIGKNFLVSIEKVQNALTQDLGGAILQSLSDADGTFDSLTNSIVTLIQGATPLISLFASTLKLAKPLIIAVGALGVAYSAYRASSIALQLVKNLEIKSFAVSTTAKLKDLATTKLHTIANRQNLASTVQASLATKIYAGAATAAALASAGASAAVRGLTIALRGLGAATLVGGAIVLLGIGLEKLIGSLSGGSNDLTAFNKGLELSRNRLAEATTETLRITDSNNKFIKSLRALSSSINSVYNKQFNASLKTVGEAYVALIDNQEAYTTLFGKGIDKVAAKSVDLVKALDKIIEKTDEALGQGKGDSSLLKTLDRDLEILKTKFDGLFDPFSQIENVSARFKKIEEALKKATDPSTVNNLAGKLKSLAKEQAGLALNPLAANDQLIKDLKRINKLQDENNKRIGKKARIEKVSREKEAIRVNTTKEQVDRLAKEVLATEDLGAAIKELRIGDDGLIIYDDTKIGKSKAALKAIVALLDKQAADTPAFAKALEKQKIVYEDRLRVIKQTVDKELDLIKLQDRRAKAQERLATAEKNNRELSKQQVEETTKLSNTLENIKKLGKSQTLKAGTDALGGPSGISAGVLEEGTRKGLFDELRGTESFSGFGKTFFGLVEQSLGALGPDFNAVIETVSGRLNEVTVAANDVANSTGEDLDKNLAAFNVLFSESLTKDSVAFLSSLNEAISAEYKKALAITQDVKSSDSERSKARAKINELKQLVSDIGLGDLDKDGIQGLIKVFGENIDSESLRTGLLKQIGLVTKVNTSFDANQKILKKAKEDAETLLKANIDLKTSAQKLTSTFDKLDKIIMNLDLVKGKIEEKEEKGKDNGGAGKYGGGRIYGAAGVDRVPAMLTAGEFVMPRDSAQKYLPLLESMRRGSYVPPQYYAQGGMVSQSGTRSLDNSVSVGDINVTVQSSGSVNAREIAQAINAEIRSGAIRMRR